MPVGACQFTVTGQILLLVSFSAYQLGQLGQLISLVRFWFSGSRSISNWRELRRRPEQ